MWLFYILKTVQELDKVGENPTPFFPLSCISHSAENF